MNTTDEQTAKSIRNRLLKAAVSERRAWLSLMALAIIAAVAGFTPIPPLALGVAGSIAALAAAWACIGADDRLLKLRDEIKAHTPTGAGSLWTGKDRTTDG